MRCRFIIIALFSLLITVFTNINVATAQFPFYSRIQPPSLNLNIKDLENKVVAGPVYLDGKPLFSIAAPRASLNDRLQNIQDNLADISKAYLRNSEEKLDIDIRTENGLPVIYVNERYLLTITQEDAKLRGFSPTASAFNIQQELLEGLKEAKYERTSEYITEQGKVAAIALAIMIVLSGGVYYFLHPVKNSSEETTLTPAQKAYRPISTLLDKQQQGHIREVKKRLFQIAQAGIWGGGALIILSLFPYTRALQVGIIAFLKIPLRLGIVALVIYVAIRLSYALTERLTSAFVKSTTLLTPETSERLQLRVSTISGVAKSIITFIWLGVGILLALTALGIDIIPLLAGVSLIGVALSLASQSLIKDAINGFLIIMEDQYALGDVITVGDVGGLVENLNLRITQVRDAEGRLITIPNSEIKIVANLSSRWSRADLNIPIAYQADIDQALQLIKTVGFDMDRDVLWEHQIIEPPEVLGIENFGDRGLIVRVWIKTQPLKQWNVAREYRRRLKIAFDKAGISIPIPQQNVWLNSANN
ncbi:MAG: mechanosensitive ion channel family protein [Rivularia sp. (in: Bacteria)]|nr:mechanosensitive ion channel family protein [Rivularia sp. MS3]